ncbi:Mycophenolic acid acyl-glucuronide esterase, mitochondrial [Gracilariopsis chorda]|uniref:Palmitoyl-protein thioesterase ABHD10, mitochondrial n=1 Tax=Gracilariopsis chorda TaxID=448386 RepID=A0A2V3IZS3_9FLOR|nr:Mycophenolic acid acyl-glucuronide esterase, mitochondrial [Gracilariopsis chorda]|eukprot:PXF47575.1 Mycophenolic acid acyl-glucuronide esterase, mitochondrial [Gracilariopsis chorda]
MTAFVSVPVFWQNRPGSALPRRCSKSISTPPITKDRVTRPLVCSIQPEPAVHESALQLCTGYDCKIEFDGRTVAYDFFPGSSPTIMFLPGFFFSRWRQAKANALEIFAKRKGQAIFVQEYLGIGKSEGDFVTDGTLSHWIQDSLRIIDRVIRGRVVLVGAGVGGWIMLHLAMMRPDNVVGLVGLNPSVDFTEDLIRPNLSPEQLKTIESDGFVNMPWGYRNYPISKALLEDAKKWLVLTGGPSSLDITCPVRILQGLSDEELPPRRMLELVDKIKSEDCVLSYVKYGDHNLEEEEDFTRMWGAVCDVSDKFFEYDLTTTSSG